MRYVLQGILAVMFAAFQLAEAVARGVIINP